MVNEQLPKLGKLIDSHKNMGLKIPRAQTDK